MKTVMIYQKPEQLIFQAYAQSVKDFTIADEPIIKLANSATVEEIGTTVLQIVKQVRNNVAHPTDWREFEKADIKRLGFKSRKEMYTDCKSCVLSFNNTWSSPNEIAFRLLPSINQKTGFAHLPEQEIKISTIQPEAIGAAVLQAFERCQ